MLNRAGAPETIPDDVAPSSKEKKKRLFYVLLTTYESPRYYSEFSALSLPAYLDL